MRLHSMFLQQERNIPRPSEWLKFAPLSQKGEILHIGQSVFPFQREESRSLLEKNCSLREGENSFPRFDKPLYKKLRRVALSYKKTASLIENVS